MTNFEFYILCCISIFLILALLCFRIHMKEEISEKEKSEINSLPTETNEQIRQRQQRAYIRNNDDHWLHESHYG